MRAAAILALMTLTACAPFPEIDAAEAALPDAPAPALLPTEDLQARIAAAKAPGTDAGGLTARAAALRARAAAIPDP